MAFDKHTFYTRTLTAIVFVAVMLTGLLWNKMSFITLFTVILAGCLWELMKLLNRIIPGKTAVMILCGLLYIVLPVGLMLFIRLGDNHQLDDHLLKVVPCILIFSLWVNDTMAYISGSLFGKTPLSKISPKKTVEGTVIGVVLAIGMMTLAGWLTGYLRIMDWMSISGISAVAGTFGDLMESKLKRMAGVKDSGKIMPGHGGFLDRFDSMLIAIPFVFVYWILMMPTGI